MTKLLPETTQLEFGSKVSMHYQIKCKTIFEYNHHVAYFGRCPENNCSDNYVVEGGRRISEKR